MAYPTSFPRPHYLSFVLALLIAGLTALLPAVAFAQEVAADQPCASCHSQAHDAWIDSAHGTVHPESLGDIGGASCVDCHGPYIKDHPAAGTIRLSVDSSLCQDCHAATYEQWQHTRHASEGIQCISCHRPHSQDLRLTDETLCLSCHRDSLTDSLHLAHRIGEVTCTSCHMGGNGYGNTLVSALAGGPGPSHDFIVVSAQNCLDCHRADVASNRVSTRYAPETTTVSAELTAAQRANKALAALSATNLGLGLGFGGILGILFMLAAARFFPRRDA